LKCFGNNERINQDEIYEIAKLGFDYEKCNDKLDKLCKKYNIKWNDWIWELLASRWQMKERTLRHELLGEPWYFFLDKYEPNDYREWEIEIQRKGYNKT
jgi:hypothetical protein